MTCLYGDFALPSQMSLVLKLNTLDFLRHLNKRKSAQSQHFGVEQVFTIWDKSSRIKH